MKKLHDVLEPLERLTKKLQAEQYLPGDLVFDVYDCQMKLSSISRRNPVLRNMAEDMLEKLSNRLKLITKNIQFAAALYMDPRFVHRTMGDNFLTSQQQLEVVVCTHFFVIRILQSSCISSLNRTTFLLFIHQDYLVNFKNRMFPPTQTEPTPSQSLPADEEPSSPTTWQKFILNSSPDLPAVTTSKLRTRETVLSFRDRLLLLKQRTITQEHVTTFEYWHKRKYDDPEMTAVAAVVLALPSTQVTVERAFSYLPLIITNRRVRLRTTTVNDILTIKLNNYQKAKVSWDSVK